jgi:hypothetical protein
MNHRNTLKLIFAGSEFWNQYESSEQVNAFHNLELSIRRGLESKMAALREEGPKAIHSTR